MGMGLSKQVTSLDLSKKLKEFGVKQNSLWHWFIDASGIASYECPILKDEWIDGGWSEDPDCSLISAFTSSELLDILSTRENNETVRITNGVTAWVCDYGSCRTVGETDVDAVGKMVAYLAEYKLIEL